MARYWTFKDYIGATGENEILAWLNALPKRAKARINAAIGRLEAMERLEMPYVRVLKGPCGGLMELRIPVENVQYRPLCCYGPGQKEVTLLLGAIERGEVRAVVGMLDGADEKSTNHRKGGAPVTMTSARYEQIAASLHDKEYRDLVVGEEINTGLPFQIRAIRQARDWSQKELAERVGMTQEGISRLESLNYGKYTLATLKRLASAFDVALVVRFVPFSHLVYWMANFTPEDLAVPDYEHDPGLHDLEPERGSGPERASVLVGSALTAEPLPPITKTTVTGNIFRLMTPSTSASTSVAASTAEGTSVYTRGATTQWSA